MPDYFFVFDEIASNLTNLNARAKVNCIVSGSPKHEKYADKISYWSKKIPFQLENKKSILYIAQPSEIKGTLENFVTFVDVLSN